MGMRPPQPPARSICTVDSASARAGGLAADVAARARKPESAKYQRRIMPAAFPDWLLQRALSVPDDGLRRQAGAAPYVEGAYVEGVTERKRLRQRLQLAGDRAMWAASDIPWRRPGVPSVQPPEYVRAYEDPPMKSQARLSLLCGLWFGVAAVASATSAAAGPVPPGAAAPPGPGTVPASPIAPPGETPPVPPPPSTPGPPPQTPPSPPGTPPSPPGTPPAPPGTAPTPPGNVPMPPGEMPNPPGAVPPPPAPGNAPPSPPGAPVPPGTASPPPGTAPTPPGTPETSIPRAPASLAQANESGLELD